MISNHVNHVNTAYYTSNRQTPASGTNANTLPAASAYSTISDSLVKVILILLSGLLLANSVLFYKMWDLEAKLGSPLSNLEEVLFEATREHGASMDRTTWLKILQRQEAAHQLELQKWHDLLGTAASLLKQVCTYFPNPHEWSPICEYFESCQSVFLENSIFASLWESLILTFSFADWGVFE